VLLPHGLPSPGPSLERLSELILRMDGDLGRCFDDPRGSPEEFARHIGRIDELRSGERPVLVVLTCLNPLQASVPELRQALEQELPALERAPWILYADPLADPECLHVLRELGEFDGPALRAPLWIGPDRLRYLVLSPLTEPDIERELPARVCIAEHGSPVASGPRDLFEESPSARAVPVRPSFSRDPFRQGRRVH
jgi:hypothetical protein